MNSSGFIYLYAGLSTSSEKRCEAISSGLRRSGVLSRAGGRGLYASNLSAEEFVALLIGCSHPGTIKDAIQDVPKMLKLENEDTQQFESFLALRLKHPFAYDLVSLTFHIGSSLAIVAHTKLSQIEIFGDVDLAFIRPATVLPEAPLKILCEEWLYGRLA